MRGPVRRLRALAASPRIAPWLTAQNWRIGSGIVLLAFATTHFLNHALGIFGAEVLEAAQAWRRAFWRSTPGTLGLYGAATIHVGLAIIKLARRTTWRMPAKEALQLALGFTIPIMLHVHITATRGIATAFGVNDTYTHELRLLWYWPAHVNQTLLVLIVWGHAMLGLDAVFSARRGYSRWRGTFLAAAALVPALAIAGWIAAAREVAGLEFAEAAITRRQFDWIRDWERFIDRVIWGVLAAIALVLLALALFRARGRRIAVRYVGGRALRVPIGPSLLETSRAFGVAHASVCGGRARCSTCRVRVLEGGDQLESPTPREKQVLARIAAPPGVRLACRIRPTSDLTVELLVVPEQARSGLPGAGDAARWGMERHITVVFGDLRGFTTLTERNLAFDVVFLLNRYVAEMTEAVERQGGLVDKFLGDGVLALFGASGAADQGSRAALAAALDMQGRLEKLDAEFGRQVGQPLRMGIGMHTGSVILGRVGATGSNAGLTALGDTVNTASRLQDMTKSFDRPIVVSEATLRAAGASLAAETRHEVSVRGRTQSLAVHALELGALAELTRPRAPATIGT